MSLKITYQGNDVVVKEGSAALIGSGEASQIRIARPGISRRHAAITFDGAAWKVEDADSRNGTFVNGKRIHVTTIDGPTTLVLGHPTDGEVVTFTPIADISSDVQDEIDAFVLPDSPPLAPPPAPRPQRAAATAPTTVAATAPRPAAQVETNELNAAIRDQIAAIRGLTWSVWAMIAVTAALCVLTLFVGILGS
ncbi:MAG: FHA domain-containing protein [Acidimicrobiia bacterium]|nr:FHA domain-containing protein [Acidimicrobiia bacterium]